MFVKSYNPDWCGHEQIKLNRAVRIFGSPKIYEIMSYLKWNNGSPVTYSRYKLSGCTYVRYGKTADSLSHNLI